MGRAQKNKQLVFIFLDKNCEVLKDLACNPQIVTTFVDVGLWDFFFLILFFPLSLSW